MNPPDFPADTLADIRRTFPPYLGTPEASALLARLGLTIAPRSLVNRRSLATPGSPPYRKTPTRAVLYPRETLIAWAAEQLGLEPPVETGADAA